jgi:uncharacterized protein with HEPN domain
MPQFPRIDNTLQTISDFLQQLHTTEPAATEISSYLTASAILTIVSEYEDYIESIFIARAAQCEDAPIVHYVRYVTTKQFRNPSIEAIKDHLSRFGDPFKNLFSRQLETESANAAAWDSLMTARHAIVHKEGSLQLTFQEVQSKYPNTLTVINCLMGVLGVTDQQISALDLSCVVSPES